MSLFVLPSAPIPLADTGAVSYRQIDLSTALSGTRFTQNQHVFRYALDGNTWWIPQRSYLRVRAKFFRKNVNNVAANVADDIKVVANTYGVITEGDGVAPVYGFCSSLFQSMQHDMSGSTVSAISNYVPQIDTMRYRTSKNAAWRQTLGASSNCYESFFKRQQKILGSTVSRDAAPEIIKYRRADIQANPDSSAPNESLAATSTITIAAGTHSYRDDGNFGASVAEAAGAGGAPARATSIVTLATGGNWQVMRAGNRLQIGDFITLSYGATAAINNVAAHVRLETHRVQVLHITAAVLHVYPSIPANALTLNFDFIIEHVIQKQDTLSSAEVEFLWSPPLSLWQDVTHALPSSVHELRLTANNNYENDCLEVLNPGNKDKHGLEITDMKLFLGCVDGPPVGMDEKQSYVLNMADWQLNMAPVAVSGGPNSAMRPFTFDVTPSTTQLAFAFQSADLASRLQSVSEFTSLNSDAQKGLARFYIQYAGQQRPTPDSDSIMTINNNNANNAIVQSETFANGSKDFSTQRWWETIINTNQLYSPGGTETRIEWFNLGPFYFFAWPKNPSDISTRVSIQLIMNNQVDMLNLLLFSRSNTAHQISLANGRVISVQTELVFGSPSMVAPQGGSGMAGGSRSMMYRY